MNLLQIILLIVIAAAGWPVGLFIASKTAEELRAGRQLFKIICLMALTAALASIAFVPDVNSLALMLTTFIFIFLLAAAALSYRKKK
jgi:hypothetical protein